MASRARGPSTSGAREADPDKRIECRPLQKILPLAARSTRQTAAGSRQFLDTRLSTRAANNWPATFPLPPALLNCCSASFRVTTSFESGLAETPMTRVSQKSLASFFVVSVTTNLPILSAQPCEEPLPSSMCVPSRATNAFLAHSTNFPYSTEFPPAVYAGFSMAGFCISSWLSTTPRGTRTESRFSA